MNEPTIGYVVWRLAMRLRVSMDRALAPLGLTHAQYSLIASLYGLRTSQAPTQKQLADLTGLEPMYVSKLARQLETKGWVERLRDSHDTRAVRLAITSEGTAVTREAIAVTGRLLDQVTAPLGGRGSRRAAEAQAALEAMLAAPIDTDH
ncbi:DNA-binding MarR family transcriptional regulator [Nocardioides luteus]|uniref:MarR family transcriptional regulator n=1 Tax=Nocardioides luteus TaxID=1844 RepID=A0ABQ5SUQ1_9ACTN|nr:MarR family transcriptional regulator [Nocardioides luteus]MDR7309143.1 DNA-binding MarR family transcriptional regulator [Nocardioides luteus]GGR49504.1 MarR family transcriptional regulator [Nocardioides luteus]GLJ67549.1 MarR family transcriptional regulator [Nocardioides luteus]